MPLLKNHTFRLIDEKDRQAFASRVIKEIKSKNTHYKEDLVNGNSHSILLSAFFKRDFRAFMRPGYYVDALLAVETSDEIEEVIEKLKQANISSHTTSLKKATYLVVPNINAKQVAENISLLKKKTLSRQHVNLNFMPAIMVISSSCSQCCEGKFNGSKKKEGLFCSKINERCCLHLKEFHLQLAKKRIHLIQAA
ncbi:hypothetical protein PHSC3_000166 [Chlamydiales bacterium STE3]|nr:hypothetical protein PHSC3_000166 [Chlamydiales bacterium STE3]